MGHPDLKGSYNLGFSGDVISDILDNQVSKSQVYEISDNVNFDKIGQSKGLAGIILYGGLGCWVLRERLFRKCLIIR